jgi:hypothetical protein
LISLPILSASGLLGTYREGKNAYNAARTGSIMAAAGHIACMPGRLAIGLCAAGGTAVVGAAAVPISAATAAVQLAKLGKDAWKRKSEPKVDRVRQNRRINNMIGTVVLDDKLYKMRRLIHRRFTMPALELAAATPHPKTSGKIHP